MKLHNLYGAFKNNVYLKQVLLTRLISYRVIQCIINLGVGNYDDL